MNRFQQQTHAHLSLAEENHETAQRLLVLDLFPYRWVAVVAFYSAVHYFGAYFWERDRTAVTSHRRRGQLIRSDHEVANVREHYDRLYRLGLAARYRTEFELSAHDAHNLLEVDLAEIRRVLLSAMMR